MRREGIETLTMYCVAKDLKNPEIGFEYSMNGNPKKQRAKILGSTVVVRWSSKGFGFWGFFFFFLGLTFNKC